MPEARDNGETVDATHSNIGPEMLGHSFEVLLKPTMMQVRDATRNEVSPAYSFARREYI